MDVVNEVMIQILVWSVIIMVCRGRGGCHYNKGGVV
jgi:hypothetical protein